MPFRLRAKNILLTYAQIQDGASPSFFERERAHFEFIEQVNGTPLCYRAGRELHEDGGVHLHVFISWDKPFSTRNERIFDFAGAHPNIAPVSRTPRKSWDYAGKDGDIIFEHGLPPGKDGAARSGRDSIFDEAVSCTTKEEFLECIRKGAPRDYVLYRDSLERFCERQFRPPCPTYTSPEFSVLDSHRVDGAVGELRLGVTGEGRPKSLILWGPTRTGKTVYSRSLGKYVESLLIASGGVRDWGPLAPTPPSGEPWTSRPPHSGTSDCASAPFS